MAEEYLFEGLKVLDVGTWIAGPVATTMLADYGADVVKIESPEVGDGYRQFSAATAFPGVEANYCWQLDARNKRSLALNLKAEKGQEILHRLIAGCDVYVTNQPLFMRRELNLTYADLGPLNPKMIYASLTGYGEQGPERDREAFDLVAYWARSGLLDAVRTADANPPCALPGMGDHPTAVAMYANIVTALLRRERTGSGSHVHTSLLANGLWSASCVVQARLAGADLSTYADKRAKAYASIPYETADHRWLVFTMVRTQEHLDLLFAITGLPELVVDEKFATPELRQANGHLIVEQLRERLQTRSAQDWLDDFDAAGVPAVVAATAQTLQGDAQLLANGMIMEAPEDMEMAEVVDHPLNQDGLARKPLSGAPALGEHSREVLAELGYADAEIDKLAGDGVI